jgi:hypothetical protein
LRKFRSVATQFGLSEERSDERFSSVYSSHLWRSSEEHEEHALEIGVGSGDIIYDTIGDGSGLPSRQRSCSMTAYLNAYDEESQREFEKPSQRIFYPNVCGCSCCAKFFGELHDVMALDFVAVHRRDVIFAN